MFRRKFNSGGTIRQAEPLGDSVLVRISDSGYVLSKVDILREATRILDESGFQNLGIGVEYVADRMERGA